MSLILTLVAVLALTNSLDPEKPYALAQSNVLDRGSFALYWKGARIGDERFVIREERVGTEGRLIRADAELNLKVDGRAMRMRAALEAQGENLAPRRYEADFSGPEATTIVGVLLGDRFRLDVRSPRGQELTQLLIRGRSAILDRHVTHYFAHQYYFAAQLLGSAPSVEARLIVPSKRHQISVTIEDLGMESLEIGGRRLELRRLAITPAGEARHDVWLDGDRVIKVEVPEDEWIAVRSDLDSIPSDN